MFHPTQISTLYHRNSEEYIIFPFEHIPIIVLLCCISPHSSCTCLGPPHSFSSFSLNPSKLNSLLHMLLTVSPQILNIPHSNLFLTIFLPPHLIPPTFRLSSISSNSLYSPQRFPIRLVNAHCIECWNSIQSHLGLTIKRSHFKF